MEARHATVIDIVLAVMISAVGLWWTVMMVYVGVFGVDAISVALFVGCALVPVGALALAHNLHRPEAWKRRWAMGLVLFLTLVFLVPWHPRQRFVLRLSLIPAGATIPEVRSRMQGYLGGEEAWLKPESSADADEVLNYRWNDTDGRFNSDVGQVFFRKGRVVQTEFLPD